MSNSKKEGSKNKRIEFISTSKRFQPTSSTLNTKKGRMINGTIAASFIGVFLFLGGLGVSTLQTTNAQSQDQENTNTTESPISGYDIHAKINKHDASDLSHKMDHYCKLSESIVAVCQLYDGEGADAKLAQIEFIITEDQYDQLPDKEKPSWHNHAVELTPQRGAPEFVDLPPGVNGTELLSTLQTTMEK